MARSVLAAAGHGLGRLARGLIEAAFPLACPACEARLTPADEGPLPLCAACSSALVDCGEVFCLDCARRGGSPRACRRGDHRALRAGFAWNEPLRAVIHAFKFGGAEGLAKTLVTAAWNAPAFADRPRPDLVVPVPLHRVRRRERGYDQAGSLAAAFATRAGAPAVDALVRTRATGQQAKLVASDRASNVAGAFAVRGDRCAVVRGRRVALVDDVVTTGSTMDAAARALVAAGARRVELWCVAYEPLE